MWSQLLYVGFLMLLWRFVVNAVYNVDPRRETKKSYARAQHFKVASRWLGYYILIVWNLML